jgi:DUF3012 family protein
MTTVIKILPVVLCLMFLSSCAKVGSERWCDNLKEKPKVEWSVEDASNFAKHCVKF